MANVGNMSTTIKPRKIKKIRVIKRKKKLSTTINSPHAKPGTEAQVPHNSSLIGKLHQAPHSSFNYSIPTSEPLLPPPLPALPSIDRTQNLARSTTTTTTTTTTVAPNRQETQPTSFFTSPVVSNAEREQAINTYEGAHTSRDSTKSSQLSAPSNSNDSIQLQSASVSRDVHSINTKVPNGHVVNRADASGLVTTSQSTDNSSDEVKPPPSVSKEVLEWVSRERLAESRFNVGLQGSIENKRYNIMLQRQANALRQLRLANRLGMAALSRETFDSDRADRLFESQVSLI